jgi:hypothetical protein
MCAVSAVGATGVSDESPRSNIRGLLNNALQQVSNVFSDVAGQTTRDARRLADYFGNLDPDDYQDCRKYQSRWDSDDSFSCNQDTGEWTFEQTNKWPQKCSDVNYNAGDDWEATDDFYNPCHAWEIRYGDHAPTPVPSNTKITTKPVESPTASPVIASDGEFTLVLHFQLDSFIPKRLSNTFDFV